MKKLILLSFVFLSGFSFSQITYSKSDGGTVITTLTSRIKLNEGSTLTRDFIVLNDTKCPIQLKSDFGVKTRYLESYMFELHGDYSTSQTVLAYEIHTILYNVFGEHIKTLSITRVNDVEVGTRKIYKQWYANENQVSEYLFCVSYVARVRKANGALWAYSPLEIKEELNKIAISFEESYIPQTIND